MAYDHKNIEKKWQKLWKDESTYAVETGGSKPKKYLLDMFPYPSGAGLHVGHPKGFTATDILARFYHARGFNVLHPMGFDAFGLPAENYAIKTGTHPAITTAENIQTFIDQLQNLGFNYDWNRMVDTTDPEYYRWTQWIFLELFKRGLAYEQDLPINYCPSCKTGLANEEVLSDNTCDRCGTKVERRPIRQWVLRITDYADRLLSDLDGLDWPEGIKEMQRNWIGKNEGVKYKLKVKDTELEIETYSTHFEAFYADTFAVIAADHALLAQIVEGIENKDEILSFAQKINNQKAGGGYKEVIDHEGYFTGRYLVDPITNTELPLWISSYALSDYGTGIIKCSAHDERDFNFAKKYNLPLRVVMYPKDVTHEEKTKIDNFEYCYNDFAGAILSRPENFAGRNPHEAHDDIAHYLVQNQFAEKSTQYKLRDWLFSRQRYWGEPIPLIHISHEDYAQLPRIEKLEDAKIGVASILSSGGTKDLPGIGADSSQARNDKNTRDNGPRESLVIDGKVFSDIYDGINSKIVIDSRLPILLPDVERYEPAGDGQSPLATVPDWFSVKLADNLTGKRETNTMPQWGGSCWYYLRYMDNKNGDALVGQDAIDYWNNVDEYVGGAEHAVLHLLYARFWHKVLYDIGVVPTLEPFQKLVNQGMILAYAYERQDGGLVAVDLVEERAGKFIEIETGLEVKQVVAKMSKSLKNVVNPNDIIEQYGADTLRLYEMNMAGFTDTAPWNPDAIIGVRRFLDKAYSAFTEVKNTTKDDMKAMKLLHKTVKKVGEDIVDYKFNTAISALMILLNEGVPTDTEFEEEWKEKFAILLHPFAPHMAEELWSIREKMTSIYSAPWPDYDDWMLVDDEVTIAVQVNGKLRGTLTCFNGVAQDEVSSLAHADPSIAKWMEGKLLVKEIFIPNKMLSIVVKDV